MREHPVLFNGDMVRAILAGTKTQTRRPMKRPKETCAECWEAGVPHNREGLTEPDGTPNLAGEVFGTEPYLRVRYCEHTDHTGARHRAPWSVGDPLWVRECFACPESITYYRATDTVLLPPGAKWTPSIHMPRWASRLTLKVTSVRVERVQDISEEDARAEGVQAVPFCKAGRSEGHEHVEAFEDLWNKVYGTWDANPWVWAITFEVAS